LLVSERLVSEWLASEWLVSERADVLIHGES
jgi:hypothetical protein